jgi:nuclear pore complex protein Nup85
MIALLDLAAWWYHRLCIFVWAITINTHLFRFSSLWQLGVLYLDHCPVQGLYRLELLLERVPLESECKANKVMSLAAERGLSSVVTQTCKVMGMRALKASRIGAAMSWALRSQDVTFTTFLADRLLLEYTSSGSFSSTDLLDHLGTSMVLSDRLTFLAKYREFHKLCEQGEFPTAANLLHSLMWSRLAPKYFWVTLLIDALPFIGCGGGGSGSSGQEQKALLNSEQTYELMHCLQVGITE